jgi:hypothetical protein
VDPREQRKQMNQRYVAGKFLDGESLDTIADGMIDPVKEMDYITGQPSRRLISSEDDLPPNPAKMPFLMRISFWCILAVISIFFGWQFCSSLLQD